MELCEYGCGQEGIHQFKDGTWCCSKNQASCTEVRRKNSEKHKGRISWKKGLTKEENESIRKQAEYMKNGGSAYMNSFQTEESHRKTGEKLTGRTKENDKSVRRAADKLTGRTKETHEGIRRMVEKLTGRTKENDEGRRKQAEKISGNKNPTWNNGSSFELYGFEFNNELKKKVRKRDNYTCQLCEKTEEELKKKLHPHHVDYNKRNNIEENLISLCCSCHSKTNTKIRRKHWIEFFSQKTNLILEKEKERGKYDYA